MARRDTKVSKILKLCAIKESGGKPSILNTIDQPNFNVASICYTYRQHMLCHTFGAAGDTFSIYLKNNVLLLLLF